MFDDDVVTSDVPPSALAGATITVDGIDVRVLDIGQGDIEPAAVLHIPDLAAVIAGDVAYNGIHPMLAFGGPQQWDEWIASVRRIEDLGPAVVVAGHKNPSLNDDAGRVLTETRTYIADFAAAWESADSTRGLITEMKRRYPAHGNETTLISSAAAAMKLKR
jgi:glyoxylase-like metal-dependent hydrolase (beta-lactamase superfamily II)